MLSSRLMRGFSSSVRNHSKETHNQTKLVQNTRGKSSIISIRTGSIPVNKHQLEYKSVDHQYLSRILSRNDWFLLLNHEFRARRITLTAQFVASILQNQENPLNPLRFYIWVSNIDPVFAKNQSVRGVLANTLYRKGPVVLSVQLLQDIRSSGCRVTEELLCILIGCWGRLGLAKYCAEVFGQISYLGLNPSTRLYNAVIDALVKSNSLDLAYLKFQQMLGDNCRPDRFTYNILIHGVCRTGIVDEALRLVKQMEKCGCSPNVFTYTILIDGFCNANKVHEAFRILETMKEKNVCPSEASYRSLINGVFRCVSPHEAFELVSSFVEKMSKLPKAICDTALCCLSNNSMSREVALFFKKAREKGYFPDTTTFNMAMTCLIKGFDLNETCKIFDSFIELGVKPGFSTYVALIEALYTTRKITEGDLYLTQVIKDGFLLNVWSCNKIIDCFCKAKMMHRATQTFRDMGLSNIAPNLVTFNTLLSGHCKDGEIIKARQVLEMLLKHGFKPDIFTFSSIIEGLCRAHQIEDAFKCFDEMLEWGVTPTVVTYNILIHSLCVIGDVSRSMKLLRKMQGDGINSDVFSFNALIQSFCRMNKVEKALKVFGSMLTLGLNPDNFTYSAFIKALCESRRFDEAIGIFHAMEKNGCIPDSLTCNFIIDTMVQQDRFDEAHHIISRCNEIGTKIKCIRATRELRLGY